MSISSISSSTSTQSLSDIIEAQLRAKLRHQAAAEKQSNTTSTQDSAEFSLEALKAAKDSKANPLESLVNDGTITEEQEKNIANTLQAAVQQQFGSQSTQPPVDSPGTDPLAGLVSNGTITEDQAKTIKETLDAARKSHMNNINETDPLDSLVTDGTITQDQKNAIKESFKAAQDDQSESEDTALKGSMISLFLAGIINQDQGSSIMATTYTTARQAYQRQE